MNPNIIYLGSKEEIIPIHRFGESAINRIDIVTLTENEITDGYNSIDERIYFFHYWQKRENESWVQFKERTHDECFNIIKRFVPLEPFRLKEGEKIAFYISLINQEDCEKLLSNDLIDYHLSDYVTFEQYKYSFINWCFIYQKKYEKKPHYIDYPGWEKCSKLLIEKKDSREYFSSKEVDALLFLIDKDWENQILLFDIQDKVDLILLLASSCLITSYFDAQQQIATLLGSLPEEYSVNNILYSLVNSSDSLVIRKSIKALQKRKDPNLVQIATDKFNINDPYIKLTCLLVLKEVDTNIFKSLFNDAKTTKDDTLQMLLTTNIPD
jgi:hypothetical protein